jgi:hypothetical protein
LGTADSLVAVISDGPDYQRGHQAEALDGTAQAGMHDCIHLIGVPNCFMNLFYGHINNFHQ